MRMIFLKDRVLACGLAGVILLVMLAVGLSVGFTWADDEDANHIQFDIKQTSVVKEAYNPGDNIKVEVTIGNSNFTSSYISDPVVVLSFDDLRGAWPSAVPTNTIPQDISMLLLVDKDNHVKAIADPVYDAESRTIVWDFSTAIVPDSPITLSPEDYLDITSAIGEVSNFSIPDIVTNSNDPAGDSSIDNTVPDAGTAEDPVLVQENPDNSEPDTVEPDASAPTETALDEDSTNENIAYNSIIGDESIDEQISQPDEITPDDGENTGSEAIADTLPDTANVDVASNDIPAGIPIVGASGDSNVKLVGGDSFYGYVIFTMPKFVTPDGFDLALNTSLHPKEDPDTTYAADPTDFVWVTQDLDIKKDLIDKSNGSDVLAGNTYYWVFAGTLDATNQCIDNTRDGAGFPNRTSPVKFTFETIGRDSYSYRAYTQSTTVDYLPPGAEYWAQDNPEWAWQYNAAEHSVSYTALPGQEPTYLVLRFPGALVASGHQNHVERTYNIANPQDYESATKTCEDDCFLRIFAMNPGAFGAIEAVLGNLNNNVYQYPANTGELNLAVNAKTDEYPGRGTPNSVASFHLSCYNGANSDPITQFTLVDILPFTGFRGSQFTTPMTGQTGPAGVPVVIDGINYSISYAFMDPVDAAHPSGYTTIDYESTADWYTALPAGKTWSDVRAFRVEMNPAGQIAAGGYVTFDFDVNLLGDPDQIAFNNFAYKTNRQGLLDVPRVGILLQLPNARLHVRQLIIDGTHPLPDAYVRVTGTDIDNGSPTFGMTNYDAYGGFPSYDFGGAEHNRNDYPCNLVDNVLCHTEYLTVPQIPGGYELVRIEWGYEVGSAAYVWNADEPVPDEWVQLVEENGCEAWITIVLQPLSGKTKEPNIVNRFDPLP